MDRYLITTADERSWVFDRPVLFLGEWCRRYDRKHVWSKMDAVVAEPYGLDTAQKRQDLEYVDTLVEQLLIELIDVLNEVHETCHNHRYWNIVLGHWLRRYVAVTFNRYRVLEQALSHYDISGTTIFEAKDYSLATMDSLSFIWACSDAQWNHVLFSNLLNYKYSVKQQLEPFPLKGVTGFSLREQNEMLPKPDIIKRFKGLAAAVSLKLSRETDAFIVSSYLPKKEAIKLHLSLGQLPQLWEKPTFTRVRPDVQQRLKLKLKSSHHQNFEAYVRHQLIDVIPSCYLEGYHSLLNDVNALNWPAKPKFIFTSNGFDTDELFKVWTGLKVNNNIPYFVGQHGNNYGTLLGSSKCPEMMTCDKFLTWGWNNDSQKTIPAFVFKTAGQKKAIGDPCGGLLLMELHAPHWLDPADNYYEFGVYQEEQFRFANALPLDIRQKLTVRLHHNYKNFFWFDDQRWLDHDSRIKLDLGVAPIGKLIATSRLVVHSYDSTGILETLLLNIPTLCFWNHGLDHLLPEAKPYYQLLKTVGILNDTPEQAAELIAKHWDDLGLWWNLNEVQEARKAFCNQYARVEKKPIRTLKRLLKTAVT